MMYRHTARFQIVLRDALRLQSLDPILVPGRGAVPYSDESMLAALRIKKGRTTLTKFRNADLPLFTDNNIEHLSAGEMKDGLRDIKLANALWEHLSRNDYIRRALSAGKVKRVNRKQLFSERQFANTLSSFFDTHESQIKAFSKQGLVDESHEKFIEKDWICYKNSWRQPGYIVKSLFKIDNQEGEYFSIIDQQIDTGRFSSIGHKVVETSTGIAISKSEKLWCFLRETSRDQPRIFCFFRPVVALSEDISINDKEEHLSVLYGHVMETERRIRGDFYGTFVVLVSQDIDQREWSRKFKKGDDYNLEDQINVFPGPSIKPGSDRQSEKKYIIPGFVASYLKDGKARP